MEPEIQEQTSFRLKDCKEITIDNKDVRRIKILNDVVWEKNKQTETNITASGSFLAGEYVALDIEVINPHSNDIINGTAIIERDDGNGYKTVTNITIENNKGIFYTKEECTNLESTQKIKYKVTFNQVDVYLESHKEIEITIKRKTPKLQQYGETAIFPGWKIGAKLDYNGQALSNKTILFGNGDTRNTNSNGIVSITNTSNTPFSMTYSFQGDTIYNPQTVEQQYTIRELSSKTLTHRISQKSSAIAEPYQRWYFYNDYIACGKKMSYAKSKYTISAMGGDYKTPQILYVDFTIDNDINVEQTSITYTVEHIQGLTYATNYCTNVYFPYIDFYLDNNISSKKRYTPEHDWFCGYECTRTKKMYPVASWNNSGQRITIEYAANDGPEEGYIEISNIKVTIKYKSKQTTNFG